MYNALVEVYGCSANSADAEIISGLLHQEGYLINKSNKIDVIILLTCIVKNPTERKVIKRIKKFVEMDKPLIIAGCMPQVLNDVIEEIAPNASMVGPNNINEIVEVVKSTINGKKIIKLDGQAPDRSCQPRIRKNKIIQITPISSGCCGDCTYCIVKFARGKITSFPQENILKDIKNALNEGCKEVWITAEDTAAYNYQGVKLDELLDSITKINGNFMVRVGMMTPNQAIQIRDNLIKVFKNEKIFKFLHLPVQSGSNEVLKKMNRYYSIEDFKGLINKFKEEIPELSISTDIICGFPEETNEQFQETIRLIEWLRPDVLNISKFGLRPGTEAGKMKQVSGNEIKKRSTELSRLWKKISIEKNQRWLNWEGYILVDEKGYNNTFVGRNSSYKAIVISNSTNIGSLIKVRVTEALHGYLKGVQKLI
ncbi:tRNA (N(6)-L-threonylcarbamoyladenosine(37)-C(2))-methylthiotransferase [Candidatus Bathyarchaeota archaeon]|nr:tRNA (N(6)-L-threonylcarbamoyladenosine(37)-C(2))-methylthiotransferase [Candidatus Bathyarchaeota archaeon]